MSESDEIKQIEMAFLHAEACPPKALLVRGCAGAELKQSMPPFWRRSRR